MTLPQDQSLMAAPSGFTWIEKPLLAALARPSGSEDLTWLREHGIELLLTLTEDRLRRDWIEDAGLLVYHEPLEDMEAPTQDQLDRAVSAIVRANERKMGVAVHCGAGLGRTGVVLAAYFVARGLSAANAIARIRRLRPGSIETDEQAAAVELFARRRRQEAEDQ
ncbi:MAG TPA: dual specificity protein phosphatase family protein [Gemmataceae bacterium]